MGCDGGTIPKRDELVRTKKKPEQKDKNSELSFRWQHCTISQTPLQSPIVSCGLGRLYNKVAVIEAILDRTNLPDVCQHIKSLKDVKDLQLTNNPSFKPSAEKGDAYIDRQTSPYICPVIGLEMNGKFKFVFVWSCGCVVSERALKEVKTKTCHKCQKPFSDVDIVIMNAEGDDLELMKTRLEARQARLRAEKKNKCEAKRRNKIAEQPIETAVSGSSNSTETNKPGDTSQMNECNGLSSTKKGLSTISVKTISKLIGNKSEMAAKRPSSGDISDPQFKKTKGSYSVSSDPRATEVFKSLFTTHKRARDQTKAHWVTYNPFYN
uniref:Replication termination factor 2 n=1 Tax=Timema californicum TaxID=61474 RepID=A0A7R9P347_TIMCA|nr:unnamed protein product [Timema californicum]